MNDRRWNSNARRPSLLAGAISLTLIAIAPSVDANGGCAQNVCLNSSACCSQSMHNRWKQFSCSDVASSPGYPGGCCNTKVRDIVCGGQLQKQYMSYSGKTGSTCDSYPLGTSSPPCKCGFLQ